jgi:FKBP-type peptidyl-prolyl cis-trans isomerase FklB
MNTNAVIVGLFLTTTTLTAFSEDVKKERTPVTKEQSSYAIGVNIGGNLKRSDIDLDFDQFLKGIKDTMTGAPTMNEQQVREVLTQFQQELMAKQQEKRRQIGEKNKTDSVAFLEANKTKPGVVTLENGLQYKVIKEGDGAIPTTSDMVEVNYRGTLIDGTEFDSSAKAGRPVTFNLTSVIKGWTEALTRMKAGSKWELYIPSDLGYGEFGSGQRIGPNAALIFELELLSIKPTPPPPAPAAPLTSDIIKVPSAEEMKKGAKIETLKQEDVEKLIKEQQSKDGKAK